MPPAIRPATPKDIPLLIQARLDFLRALGYPMLADDLPKASRQLETFLSEHLERDLFAHIALEGETLAAAGFLQVIQVMWQPAAPAGQLEGSSTCSPGQSFATRVWRAQLCRH